MTRSQKTKVRGRYFDKVPMGRVIRGMGIGYATAGGAGATIGATAGGLLAGIPGAVLGGIVGHGAFSTTGSLIGQKIILDRLDTEGIRLSDIADRYVDAGREFVEPIKDLKFDFEK